ncbi:guanylate kinase [[Clostridium] colinum]|uniref:guanylate kinase n=1 Tax=[Clostridium] colinum TaxID=36835 RepID=UPI002024C6F0|nr:guanylate kinase [[Clostridium] colinum]
MNKKGLLVIVSGPSGAGKGTVVSELIKNKSYALSTSITTREARQGEVDGVHYFFRDTEEFKKMIEKNELLEYAEFCGNYYGTPMFYVQEQLEQGKNVILEIEVQGALQVKERYKDAILIFLTPPNITELRNRLEKRATETLEKINMRMKRAREEITLINKYDYIVINNIVEEAVKDINNIVESEKMSAKRHTGLIDIFLEGVEE